MRISIWQQFSSNHSARFTIVGHFENTQQANKAADELRHILKSIVDWNETHPELAEMWNSGDLPEPTEPEVQFSKQYGVNWGESAIPWFWQAKVITLDNIVFVDSDGQADDGAQPFHSLVAKLGARVFIEGQIEWDDAWRQVSVELSCSAPNEAVAQAIEREVKPYFEPPRGDVWVSARAFAKVAPWELYGTNYRLPFVSNILAISQRDFFASLPLEPTRNMIRSLIPLLGTHPLTNAHIQAFVDAILEFSEYGFQIVIDREKLVEHLDEIIRHVFNSKHIAWGDIYQDKEKIHFKGVLFSDIAYGLPALTRYLTDKGCTDIRYSFAETNDED